MEWLSQNWVWLLFFAGFIAMHVFAHGGHGGHSGHGGGDGEPKPVNGDEQRTSEQGPHHHH